MKNVPNIIEKLGGSENERLEFKSSLRLETVGQNVVAFLNTSGGHIVIGVNENLEPVGLTDIENKIKHLEDFLNSNIFPTASWSIVEQNYKEQSVIIIEVPMSYHFPYTINNAIYIRRKDKTVKANPQDLKDLFALGVKLNERWERKTAIGWNIEDLDKDEIKKTQDSLELHSLSYNKEKDYAGVLTKLNLLEEGQLFNSAVVLFGISPQKHLPQTRIRVAVMGDSLGEEIYNNHVLEGNAFNLFSKVMDFLEINIRSVSKMNGMLRKDNYVLPRFILRESILNAIIHRDYSSFESGIHVNIFSDRLEIWNPGRLPDELTPKNISQGYVSVSRNPDIAHVFYIRGLVERLGMGARRIVEECKNVGLPKPKWQEVAGGVRLTIYLIESKKSSNNSERVIANNSRIINFLNEISLGEVLSLNDYRNKFAIDVSERTARRDIETMIGSGLVEAIPSSRKILYKRIR